APPCPADWLVLQAPARPLLEGDEVTLRCRAWRDWDARVRFYHEGRELEGSPKGPELSLPPLRLHHGGRYRCGGEVGSVLSAVSALSAPVTVTVH
ncbi:FCGR3 protein, partial [Onychorhynchus coronatus]|nr:FCGR3 protein [Onychorhynchus coronatus]